jgi:DNA-binding response OmpR family regulator
VGTSDGKPRNERADSLLEQAVWAETYVEDPERLKTVIKRLRQALGEEAARLENVRGVGYRFSP